MSKTCLVCNTIHLEMIGILRHTKNVDSMLKCLLGLQAQQDDYLCHKCCNDVINAFESKQKSHQFGLFESKVLRADGANIKYEVDQAEQSETAAFNMSEVKMEPKSEDLEDVNDGTTGINYEKIITSGLETKIQQERSAVEKYGPIAQRNVIIGGKHESNSTELNTTMSSSTLNEIDFNIATPDYGCKQIDSGEHSKRHNSVGINDSIVVGRPNDEGDVRDISSINTGNRPANKKPYVCCECEKSFITSYKLKIHERLHTREKPYKCQECEKCFISLFKLKIHERDHIGEKPYKCCECDKSFTTAYKLKIHQRNHTGEKPYKCHECEKCFTTFSQLKVHERIHTGEKPYKCSQCEKSFIKSSNLQTHKHTHAREKPHKCCECGKSYTTSTNLKIHERSHTGEKPYKCHECKRSFTTFSLLKIHERNHTGEKPYKCFECGKSFARISYLKVHERIHTGEKPYKRLQVL